MTCDTGSESTTMEHPQDDSAIDSISAWSTRFSEAGTFKKAHLPDADERIRALHLLWDAPLDVRWHRDIEDHRWNGRRYRRGDHEAPHPGEHWLEHDILNRLDSVRCLGGRLVDGVNAFPLGQPGKVVEADLVLLAEIDGQMRILVVEAKWKDAAPWGSNDPWYAVVENLKQLRLFTANRHARRFFHRRDPRLAADIPVSGVVLAPAQYFGRTGKLGNSLEPARKLIDSMKSRVEVLLAAYDPTNAEIRAVSE